MNYRAAYREAARTALAAHPRFLDIKILKAWAGSIDVATLPVLGVITASETVQASSQGRSERQTTLQVVLKRTGGETIDDELDIDAATIEQVVQAALLSINVGAFPSDITFALNGDGRERVGTVVVTFRIKSWRTAP